jgi:LAO/AO transport system kinase
VDLLERFYRGDGRALSRVITQVENRAEGSQELLGQLYEKAGQSLRIGVTGPPGAGKSTLVNCLAQEFLKSGKRVGIIAVDPSSPFTGGALLGDRVRMNEFPPEAGVYFRSMATRGAAGGLAATTGNVSVVLDAFGFDITLIETVGVGQVELDIVDACDTVAVVVVPESGDAVQTMKAGLMEIADIMVVNKSDRPGAENLVHDLRHTVGLRKKDEAAWQVRIVQTEAVNAKGIDTLHASILEHVEFSKESGRFDGHRRRQIERKILSILRNRFQREFLERLGDKVAFDQIIEDIAEGRANPYEVAEDFYARFSNCAD